MKRCLLVAFLVTSALSAAAQTPSQIKASPAWLWAEGKGANKAQADAAALEELTVCLAATDILDVEPSRRLPLWRTYTSDLKEHSSALEISSKEVLRYIAWDGISAVFTDRWRKVRELVSSAEAAQGRGATDEARTYCHWAEIYLASLPAGEEQLRERVSVLSRKLGKGSVSAVRMRNIESETASISRALGAPPKKGTALPRSDSRDIEVTAAPDVPAKRAIPYNVSILPPGTAILSAVVTGPAEKAVLRAISPGFPANPVSSAPSFQPGAPEHGKWNILFISDIGRIPSFGLQSSWTRGRWGAYLCARHNFNFTKSVYSCLSDGSTDFGYIWASGHSCGQSFAASAGPVIRITDIFGIYMGAGYGCENLLWEDSSGRWALVTDLSYRGVLAEGGLLLSFGRLTVCTGVCSTAFRQASARLGLGLNF